MRYSIRTGISGNTAGNGGGLANLANATVNVSGTSFDPNTATSVARPGWTWQVAVRPRQVRLTPVGRSTGSAVPGDGVRDVALLEPAHLVRAQL